MREDLSPGSRLLSRVEALILLMLTLDLTSQRIGKTEQQFLFSKERYT